MKKLFSRCSLSYVWWVYISCKCENLLPQAFRLGVQKLHWCHILYLMRRRHCCHCQKNSIFSCFALLTLWAPCLLQVLHTAGFFVVIHMIFFDLVLLTCWQLVSWAKTFIPLNLIKDLNFPHFDTVSGSYPLGCRRRRRRRCCWVCQRDPPTLMWTRCHCRRQWRWTKTSWVWMRKNCKRTEISQFFF